MAGYPDELELALVEEKKEGHCDAIGRASVLCLFSAGYEFKMMRGQVKSLQPLR